MLREAVAGLHALREVSAQQLHVLQTTAAAREDVFVDASDYIVHDSHDGGATEPFGAAPLALTAPLPALADTEHHAIDLLVRGRFLGLSAGRESAHLGRDRNRM